jgi:hypothetical protein
MNDEIQRKAQKYGSLAAIIETAARFDIRLQLSASASSRGIKITATPWHPALPELAAACRSLEPRFLRTLALNASPNGCAVDLLTVIRRFAPYLLEEPVTSPELAEYFREEAKRNDD